MDAVTICQASFRSVSPRASFGSRLCGIDPPRLLLSLGLLSPRERILDHAVPTSNKEKLASKPASLFRCEECHDICHIFGLSNAPKWDLQVQPLLQLWRNLASLNWSWRDHIDCDS